MLGMLIGLLSGMLMSIQGVFNAEVTKQAGVWVAAGFVQITAFVICVAAWFVTGKEGSISGIVQVKPWYMLLGPIWHHKSRICMDKTVWHCCNDRRYHAF